MQPLAGLVTLGLLLLIVAMSPAEPMSPDPVSPTASAHQPVARVVASAPVQSAPFDPIPNPYPSRAVEIAETFLFMVDQGDVDAVFDLLIDDVSRPGTGTAQYPSLPTDASLWANGVLDRSAVEAFVLHASSESGSVEVDDCRSVAGGVTTTLVGCTFTTTGVVARPGPAPETGRLYVVTMDHKVAGMIAFGDPDDAPGQSSTDVSARRSGSGAQKHQWTMLSRVAAE